MAVMLFMSAWMIVQELFDEKSFMGKIQDQLLAKPELKRRMGRVKTSSMRLLTEPLPHTTSMQINTSDSAYFFEVTLDSIDGDIRLIDYKLNEVNAVEPWEYFPPLLVFSPQPKDNTSFPRWRTLVPLFYKTNFQQSFSKVDTVQLA